MFLFMIVLIVLFNQVLCQSQDQRRHRIIGGHSAKINDYPYAVSLQRRHGSHLCGGTYISPGFILTAAHCLVTKIGKGFRWRRNSARRYIVIAGTTNIYFPQDSHVQLQLLDKLLPHEYFRHYDMRYDVGLCRLKHDFRLTESVQLTTLPSSYGSNLIYRSDEACSIVGWGVQDPETLAGSGSQLHQAKIPLIPAAECPMSYYKDSQLCAGKDAGGVDSCQGDSGGPLVCNKTQVGIVSFGFGCAKPKMPGVYTRVDYFLIWINKTIEHNYVLPNRSLNNLLILFSLFLLFFLNTILSRNK